MSIELPKPIADYVAANARLDVDAMMRPFAPDAVVLDIDKRFEGPSGIRKLIVNEIIPAKAIFTPDAVRHEQDRIVIEGPAHGDFPGSPIRFTYKFTLANDAIKALEITL